MDLVYIIAIVAGSLFLLLLLIFLCAYVNSRRKFNAKQNELRNMYADKNTPKMDYDFAVYDEEVERMLKKGVVKEGQLTIDDVMGTNGVPSTDETVFASVDVDSVEEITGSYNPD